MISMAGPYTLERPAVFLESIFDQTSGAQWRPIDTVSEAGPPTLLLHGEADNIVWVEEAQTMATRLGMFSVPADLRIYPDRSHLDVLLAWWWPLQFRVPVRDDVKRFIDGEVADDSPRAACLPGN